MKNQQNGENFPSVANIGQKRASVKQREKRNETRKANTNNYQEIEACGHSHPSNGTEYFIARRTKNELNFIEYTFLFANVYSKAMKFKTELKI